MAVQICCLPYQECGWINPIVRRHQGTIKLKQGWEVGRGTSWDLGPENQEQVYEVSHHQFNETEEQKNKERHRSVCLSLSICLSIYLCQFLSSCLSVFVSLSLFLLLCLTLSPYSYLSLSLPPCVCLSFCLGPPPSLFLPLRATPGVP